MRITDIIQRWGLIKTFAFSSFISIVTISIVSGFIFFSYLRNNLLDQELSISSEFIQSITLIRNNEKYFLTEENFEDRHEVDEFLLHIISMPDVFRVVAYNAELKILFANNPKLIGKTFTDNDELERALTGVSLYEEAEMDDHHKAEHETIPDGVSRFIESYIPIWDRRHENVIGVLEIYKSPRALYQAIHDARYLVILVALLSAIILHWVLYWIVLKAHQLIETQRVRIKQATKRTVELNEQNLRRIGADLHDGPAQSIGFALLRFDSILESGTNDRTGASTDTINKVRMALQDALQEIRDLSAGLIIPELDEMTLREAIIRMIEKHEKRTSTKVNYNMHNLPDQLGISIKICVYRLVQEGLTNAFKHGMGKGQEVWIDSNGKMLKVIIRDSGPGLQDNDITTIDDSKHLGIRGLRERVESLGGDFELSSNSTGPGVELTATLPVDD